MVDPQLPNLKMYLDAQKQTFERWALSVAFGSSADLIVSRIRLFERLVLGVKRKYRRPVLPELASKSDLLFGTSKYLQRKEAEFNFDFAEGGGVYCRRSVSRIRVPDRG